jgi:gliding motility-associated transport system permease protein
VSATRTILRRELGSYFGSWTAYIVAAVSLLVAGIIFQGVALGAGPRLSAAVLEQFFWTMSGVVQILGLAMSFWVIAMERYQNTIVLLNTSPVRDSEIVLAKFFSLVILLAFVLLLSFYLPLLILINGKLTYSQLFIGYFGLLLLGSASLAIGTFASSVSPAQMGAAGILIAGVVAVVVNGVMVLLFPLAKNMDSPLKEIFEQLDLWHIHFQQGAMSGKFNLSDLVYYLAVIYFFLLLAIKTMELKRWR